METSLLIVKTNPVIGREKEFNDWYNTQHLPEVLSVPGFISAQRYMIPDHDRSASETFEYLAIYQITGDPTVAISALMATAPDFITTDAKELISASQLYLPVPGGSQVSKNT